MIDEVMTTLLSLQATETIEHQNLCTVHLAMDIVLLGCGWPSY